MNQPYNEPEEFILAPHSKQTTHGKFIPDKEPCLYCDDDFYWHKHKFDKKYCPNCGRKVYYANPMRI